MESARVYDEAGDLFEMQTGSTMRLFFSCYLMAFGPLVDYRLSCRVHQGPMASENRLWHLLLA